MTLSAGAARSAAAAVAAASFTALLLLACCTTHARAAAPMKRMELVEKLVEGVAGPDARGQYSIEHGGVKWAVLESTAEDGAPVIMFVNTKAFAISYADPRTDKMIEIPEDIAEAGRLAALNAPPPTRFKTQDELSNGVPGDAEMDEEGRWFILDNTGVKHVVHKHEDSGRFYFHNTKTNAAEWGDPRKSQPAVDSEEDPYEDPDEELKGEL